MGYLYLKYMPFALIFYIMQWYSFNSIYFEATIYQTWCKTYCMTTCSAYKSNEFLALNAPGRQGTHSPCLSRTSSMVSSFTFTSRMGYTLGRMRLLNPQAPTCRVESEFLTVCLTVTSDEIHQSVQYLTFSEEHWYLTLPSILAMLQLHSVAP